MNRKDETQSATPSRLDAGGADNLDWLTSLILCGVSKDRQDRADRTERLRQEAASLGFNVEPISKS